jgi:hypothetical protein
MDAHFFELGIWSSFAEADVRDTSWVPAGQDGGPLVQFRERLSLLYTCFFWNDPLLVSDYIAAADTSRRI